MRTLQIVLFLACGGCGLAGGGSEERQSYDCGGPVDRPIVGRDENLAEMRGYGLASEVFDGSGRGFTTPRNLRWDGGGSRERGVTELIIDGTRYELSINAAGDAWDVKTPEATVGTFTLFLHTGAAASDASHCGTRGMKFDVEHFGARESGRFQLGIL